jgi:hypothetical protein
MRRFCLLCRLVAGICWIITLGVAGGLIWLQFQHPDMAPMRFFLTYWPYEALAAAAYGLARMLWPR